MFLFTKKWQFIEMFLSESLHLIFVKLLYMAVIWCIAWSSSKVAVTRFTCTNVIHSVFDSSLFMKMSTICTYFFYIFSNICHVITKCKSSCISMYKYVHGMAVFCMMILSWYNIRIIWSSRPRYWYYNTGTQYW